MKIILVLIYLIFTISGLIFMKMGGNSGTIGLESGGNVSFTINWISLIGFVCYLVSFLIFTKIVNKFDLSYIIPICTGIVQVITLIASKLIFNEIITIQGLIGAIIVIVGIVIMNLPK